MPINQDSQQLLLIQKICDKLGTNPDKLYEESKDNSVTAGICTSCYRVFESVPSYMQDGLCLSCGAETVVSFLDLYNTQKFIGD